MPLYFAPYTGKGTRKNPFVATGMDQPGSSCIDLRADGGATLAGGGFPYALLWLPAGSVEAASLIKLGEHSGEAFALASKTILSSKLPSLDFSKDTLLVDILSTLLISPPKNAWNPLMPANGRLEAWLGSENGKQRWVDQPVLAGGSLSDSFNRANETPLAAPWTVLSGSTGTINLASNTITKVTSGDCFYYYSNAGGWNADQSSEFVYASAVGSVDWGPAVRIGSNGFSGYFYDGFSGGGINKFVAGSFSLIENGAGSPSVGQTVHLDVTGSTISYLKNGTPDTNSPGTDTSLTTAGNGAGVFWYQSGGTIDTWAGTGEISSGSKMASAGVGAASGVGGANALGVMASSGVGASSVVGRANILGVMASAGVGTPSGVGGAKTNAVAASAGVGASSVSGDSIISAVGSSAGLATPSGVSAAQKIGVAASAGSATPTGSGDSIINAAMTSAGLSSALGVGASTVNAVASSSGAAASAMAGDSAISAVGSSSGIASPSGVGASSVNAAGSSSGVASPSIVGASVFNASMASAGSATPSGVGESNVDAVGSSAGIASVSALGYDANGGSIADSAGTSSADATGASTAQASGVSAGTATGIATGVTVIQASGSSAGDCTVVGSSVLFRIASAQALGIAAVGADGSALYQATGSGVGEALALAIASWTQSAVALSVGMGDALGSAFRPSVLPVVITPSSNRTYTYPSGDHEDLVQASSRTYLAESRGRTS